MKHQSTSPLGARLSGLFLALLLSPLLTTGAFLMAYEEPRYTVLEKYPTFEIRRYEAQLLIEVEHRGNFESIGNRSFGSLFGFISGKNETQEKISMTVPVYQQETRSNAFDGVYLQTLKEAPQAELDEAELQKEKWYRFSFILPRKFLSQPVPTPKDSAIIIRTMPEKVFAVREYKGSSSAQYYLKQQKMLRAAMQQQGVTQKYAQEKPVFARYSSPFTIWFLRRNAVMIELKNYPKPQ